MDKDFSPLHIVLSSNDDSSLTPDEQQRLRRGENVVRVGDWGWRTLAVAPLNERTVVQNGRATGSAGRQSVVLEHQRPDRRDHARVPVVVAAPALA